MLTTQSPTYLQGHYALPSCPKAWRRTKFQKQLFKEKKQWYFPHCGSYWISRQSLTHAWSSIQSFCIHTWYNWCISASIPDTTDVSLHKYLIQLMYFCIDTWYNWCISALIPDMTDVLYLHRYLIRLMYYIYICIDTWYDWCISASIPDTTDGSAWWWALLFSFLNAQLSATTKFRDNYIIIRFCLNCWFD